VNEDRKRLTRSGDGALLAGVCAGIGVRLDVDPVLIRVAVVVLTLATGGVGAVAYGLLWLTLPATPKTGRTVEEARRQSRNSWIIGAGFGMVTLGLLFIFREVGLWWSDALVWPVVLAVAGGGLLWRQFSGTNEDEKLDTETESKAWAASGDAVTPARERPVRRGFGPYRGAFGFALVIGAAVLFLYVQGAFSAAGDAVLAGVTLIVVLGLILAPLWVRLARNLGRERAERIRSQERAEVAAHLHDSVLQTLALMQKKSDDPRQVSTLARRQERELRDWLSGKSESAKETSLASALEAAAAEVEERHGVPIDAVTVGDRALDERTLALVAASREAMTNAVRYAGDAGTVRLYAEITPEETQVFVRDRGNGFNLDAVPEDRRGVRDSILGRMRRNGGSAEVRSGEGEGTEIELTMETR
jgi:signal transduction histidine kinase/phage shock protein PspC (stress-responsive transcriptional regulator)